MKDGKMRHDEKWSQSIAVSNQSFKSFIDEVVNKLGKKVKYREITGNEDSLVLKEPDFSYNGVFDSKKRLLRSKNTFLWDLSL